MDRLTFDLPAPAKLNLFLNIVGRRADGYHELQTVFQLIDLCDRLYFEPAPAEIGLVCDGLDIAASDNLVFKSALALRQATGCGHGARIRLRKKIPAGAGLGGGSSDAATTLAGLNLLWGLGLDATDLLALGATLGADVPLFLYGHSAWAEGIGERLQPIDLPEKWYLVVNPGCSVSTARVFADPDLTRNGTAITIPRFLRQGSGNVCEPVVRRLYPPVDAACHWLSQWGPPRMTGTGSCVFLAFDAEGAAREVMASIPQGWTAFVTRGIEESPLPAAVDRVRQSFNQFV